MSSIEHLSTVGAFRPSTPARLTVVAGVTSRPRSDQAEHTAVRPRVAMIPNESSDSKSTHDFPQFPGEEFMSHAATQYKEQAEARFASRGILGLQPNQPRPPSVRGRQPQGRHAVQLGGACVRYALVDQAPRLLI